MQQSSLPLPASRPANATVSVERILCPALLLLFCGAVFLFLGSVGRVPWADDGGYHNMLRHFLATGKVDYMRWSQPTFVGILPLAAPWVAVFGDTTASLQALGIVCGLLTVAGLYVFAVAYTRPALAALLSLAPLGFLEFLQNVPTFMTDAPYAAYLVWFLVVHRKIEAAYDEPTMTAPVRLALLWAAWAALFALAFLTRSFLAVLVPVFLLLFLWERTPSRRRLLGTGLLVSTLLSALCLLIVRAVGVNGFSLLELADLRGGAGKIAGGLFFLLQTALLALPVLALCPEALRPRLSRGEAALAVGTLLFTVYLRGTGALYLHVLPTIPGAGQLNTLLLMALAPVAAVLLARVLRAAAAAHPTSSTLHLLLAIFAAHFPAAVITRVPSARHVLPAFLALLLIAAMSGLRPPRPAAACTLVALLLMVAYNVRGVYHARVTNALRWEMAEALLRAGTPLPEIAAGLSWYSSRYLRPGSPPGAHPAFPELEEGARFAVTPAAEARGIAGRPVLSRSAPVLGGVTTVSVIDRGPK